MSRQGPLRNLRSLVTGLFIAVMSAAMGCSEPPVPPEAQMADSQELDLWRAGAPVFAEPEYSHYLASLQLSRELLAAEQVRPAWFRDYEKVSRSYRQVLDQGESVRALVRKNMALQQEGVTRKIVQLKQRIELLRNLSREIKDRRLAARSLMRAELLLDEAEGLSRSERYQDAEERLDRAEVELEEMTRKVVPLVSRYADRALIAGWRRMLKEAVAASKRNRGYLVVVSKIDRELTLYRNGIPFRTYPAGLGADSLSDKLYAGDRATPEGKYRIVEKLPNSKFFRGLLIDYPNAEDRSRFERAKKEGRIPGSARIGGLIEIHGGGKDGLTFGCIALEDSPMKELYDLVEVGTPVVILGAVDFDNVVSSFLKQLE